MGKVYGSEWNEVYYSKCEFDYENGGKFIGYTVNGKSAAENEHNAFEDGFYTTQVPIGISAQYLNYNKEQVMQRKFKLGRAVEWCKNRYRIKCHLCQILG